MGKYQRFFIDGLFTNQTLALKGLLGNHIESQHNFRIFEMNRMNDGIGDVQQLLLTILNR